MATIKRRKWLNKNLFTAGIVATWLIVVIVIICLSVMVRYGDNSAPVIDQVDDYLWLDHETHCYYVGSDPTKLTPRLDKDGKPFCSEAKK